MDKFKGLRLKWQDDIKLDKGHTLQEVVGKDSQVKNMLVDYVGEKQKSDGDVTVEMIVETLSEEFPEFMLAIAEENWIRGYEQALTDVSLGQSISKSREEENNSENEE